MKGIRSLLIAGLVAGAAVSPVHAELVSVLGGVSKLGETFPPSVSDGTYAEILTIAPTSVFDDSVTNSAMQGFNEAQGVVTTIDYAVDGGIIAAGTRVDSHMIFLNSSGADAIVHLNVVWTFSGNILGVMSDVNGTFEAASTSKLGKSGTTYGTFDNRGLEPTNEIGFASPIDKYAVNGNQITVSMGVTQPGDWIRVVTVSPVPEPEIYAMMMAGLGLLGFIGRRKKTSQVCLGA